MIHIVKARPLHNFIFKCSLIFVIFQAQRLLMIQLTALITNTKKYRIIALTMNNNIRRCRYVKQQNRISLAMTISYR